MKNKQATNEPCEWNPDANREAMTDDEWHADAALSVGRNPNWHLCEGCAALPRFNKFKRRIPLKGAARA